MANIRKILVARQNCMMPCLRRADHPKTDREVQQALRA
jgi:hypothetical protein